MTEECGMPSPFPLLIKGWDRGSAAPLGQSSHRAQGIETDPLPQPVTTRFPASTARHPKCMEDAWRTCRTKGAGEATSPTQ